MASAMTDARDRLAPRVSAVAVPITAPAMVGG